MIHAFPKKHMVAASTVGALLTFILALSPSSEVNASRTVIPLELDEINTSPVETIQPLQEETPTTQTPEKEQWDTITIKSGNTLSQIFAQAGFNDKAMYEVLYSHKDNKSLSRIFPGESLGFQRDESGKLTKVKHKLSELESYIFERNENNKFVREHQQRTPDVHIAYSEGTIDSSLFLAGQKAGLSHSQIMELANIFGWDVDFVLDIRSGDSFSLVYEELFLDGEKLKNGKILAANFTNQGREINAVLYKQPDGFSNYFTPDGNSMRKAFIRTPVDFARISSSFNLKRKHPVLHKVRAHKGTDYAAARGTPIKAAGDGKVIHAARKGGYGKTVIIQHGQKITTLYAHMSKYAKGIRSGKRVKQGQVIGYIGSTGLASGPHLHYEFRVNGVHKNPVRVKLPHANPIPKQQMAHFKEQTSVYLAQLSTFKDSYQLAANN